MFGKCLLTSIGIGILSTVIYAILYNEKENINNKNNEYMKIFSIVLSVSFLILFIFSGDSTMLVKSELNNISGGGSTSLGGGKPPF